MNNFVEQRQNITIHHLPVATVSAANLPVEVAMATEARVKFPGSLVTVNGSCTIGASVEKSNVFVVA